MTQGYAVEGKQEAVPTCRTGAVHRVDGEHSNPLLRAQSIHDGQSLPRLAGGITRGAS